MLDTSRSGIAKLERAGQFVPRYTLGRNVYYRVQDVREWMERHREPVASLELASV
jgi:predicted DNA-binding transcriptional regulator AlpA